MKKLYIAMLLCMAQIAASSQTPPPDTALSSCIRPLFDYLMHSSRLDVSRQQNITVRDIVRDARMAGYAVDTLGCPLLQANMDKAYYTQTPEWVRFHGFIVAPADSAYIARLGNLQLTFSSLISGFEHRLSAFYPKPLRSASEVAYSTTAPVTHYYEFRLRHYRTADFMDWYVNYTDTNGIVQTKWYKPVDTLIHFYGTSVNLIQKADTINKIYVTPQYTLDTLVSAAYVINQQTYYRATSALLQIADLGPKVSMQQVNLVIRPMQNPSTGPFRLLITSASSEPVIVRLADQSGRPLEMKKVIPGTFASMGENVQPGLYYAEVIQGFQRKTIKLIRL